MINENISFWGAVRAIAGVCRSTSGPYLKLFHLYVCSIYLFVLFTQCVHKFFEVCKCSGTEN